MRLLERTLRTIYIAPGLTRTDAAGCVQRIFSSERLAVRGSLIPSGGEMAREEAGMQNRRRCTLLLPKDAPIVAGDGVAETPQGDPEWLCTGVETWSAHVSVSLERRRWP